MAASPHISPETRQAMASSAARVKQAGAVGPATRQHLDAVLAACRSRGVDRRSLQVGNRAAAAADRADVFRHLINTYLFAACCRGAPGPCCESSRLRALDLQVPVEKSVVCGKPSKPWQQGGAAEPDTYSRLAGPQQEDAFPAAPLSQPPPASSSSYRSRRTAAAAYGAKCAPLLSRHELMMLQQHASHSQTGSSPVSLSVRDESASSDCR